MKIFPAEGASGLRLIITYPKVLSMLINSPGL